LGETRGRLLDHEVNGESNHQQGKTRDEDQWTLEACIMRVEADREYDSDSYLGRHGALLSQVTGEGESVKRGYAT